MADHQDMRKHKEFQVSQIYTFMLIWLLRIRRRRGVSVIVDLMRKWIIYEISWCDFPSKTRFFSQLPSKPAWKTKIWICWTSALTLLYKTIIENSPPLVPHHILSTYKARNWYALWIWIKIDSKWCIIKI